MVLLYGTPTSSSTRRVAVVFKELGLPYQLVEVDTPNNQQKTPEHLQKHPFGQVPYIDDDGLILFESRAIARYLAFKAKSSLLPYQSASSLALFEQAASIEFADFDPFATGIGKERILAVREGRTPNEALVQTLISTLESKLEGYERILSKQRYLAGEEITLADLFHLPTGARLEPAGVDYLVNAERFPSVARWWKEITSRPSWQEVKDRA